MPKILTFDQVEQYRRDGFAFPVPVLDAGLRQGQGFTKAAE